MTAAVVANVVVSCAIRRDKCGSRTTDMTAARIATLTKNGVLQANDHIVKAVVELLSKSHVVALPTDTVYGIAGLAQDNWSVRTIYSIKRRNPAKPLAICVGDIVDIPRWAIVTVPKTLLEDLLPGPVTVVFERSRELNPNLNQGTNLVGIRIPDHAFTRRLCRAVGQPLALTSANVSDTLSSLTIEEFQNLWPNLRLIVNGGRLGDADESRLGSTVVDLSVVGHYRVIRIGQAFENVVDILANKYNLRPLN